MLTTWPRLPNHSLNWEVNFLIYEEGALSATWFCWHWDTCGHRGEPEITAAKLWKYRYCPGQWLVTIGAPGYSPAGCPFLVVFCFFKSLAEQLAWKHNPRASWYLSAESLCAPAPWRKACFLSPSFEPLTLSGSHWPLEEGSTVTIYNLGFHQIQWHLSHTRACD